MESLQIDDARLSLAARAATAAGDRAAEMKLTTSSELKGDRSIVTAADREAESIVREQLTAESEYPILGEEQGGDIEGVDSYWVVDPIDGTRSFAHGQPFYGCAIALVEAGEPTVGVWYMPELEYLFYAVEGQGAYRGDERLAVSEEQEVSESLVLVSGRGVEYVVPFISEQAAGFQKFGSAVMSAAWIASGWATAAAVGTFAPWDSAVGVVLVREAGGVVKRVDDGASDWSSIWEGRVVVGNERLVDSLRDVVTSDVLQDWHSGTYEW